jgi:SAM-dependent methyltransferase
VEYLLARNCAYWGVDHSTKMIEQCRKRFGSHPQACFSVASGTETGFPDEFFDAVLCVGVLDRAENGEAILMEMVRVLKSGGTLLITVANRWSPYLLWRDFMLDPVVSTLRNTYFSLVGKSTRSTGPAHTLYSVRGLSDWMARHDCRATEVVYTGFNFFLPPLDRFFPTRAASSMESLESLRIGTFRFLGAMAVLKASKG